MRQIRTVPSWVERGPVTLIELGEVHGGECWLITHWPDGYSNEYTAVPEPPVDREHHMVAWQVARKRKYPIYFLSDFQVDRAMEFIGALVDGELPFEALRLALSMAEEYRKEVHEFLDQKMRARTQPTLFDPTEERQIEDLIVDEAIEQEREKKDGFNHSRDGAAQQEDS